MKIELTKEESSVLLGLLQNKPEKVETITLHVNPNQIREFYVGMESRYKIRAIKAFREMTGMGLAESKQWIEGLVHPDYWHTQKDLG